MACYLRTTKQIVKAEPWRLVSQFNLIINNAIKYMETIRNYIVGQHSSKY